MNYVGQIFTRLNCFHMGFFEGIDHGLIFRFQRLQGFKMVLIMFSCDFFFFFSRAFNHSSIKWFGFVKRLVVSNSSFWLGMV